MGILSTKQRYTSKTYTTRVGNVISKTTVLTPSPPMTPMTPMRPSAASKKQPGTTKERPSSTLPTKRKRDSDTDGNKSLEDVLIDVEVLGVQHRHTYRSYQRSAIFTEFARECWWDHRPHLDAIQDLASQKWDECDIEDFNQQIESFEREQRMSWMYNDNPQLEVTSDGDDDWEPFEIVQGVARGMQQHQREQLVRTIEPAPKPFKKERKTAVRSPKTVAKSIKKETKALATVPKASPRQSEQDEEDEEETEVPLSDAPLSPKQRKRLALQKLVAMRKARAAKPVTVMVQPARSLKGGK